MPKQPSLGSWGALAGLRISGGIWSNLGKSCQRCQRRHDTPPAWIAQPERRTVNSFTLSVVAVFMMLYLVTIAVRR